MDRRRQGCPFSDEKTFNGRVCKTVICRPSTVGGRASTGAVAARPRVLVVDRATFPTDTISTHIVVPRAVEALARWGLLDRLTATGCPPVYTYVMGFGPVKLTGSPGTAAAPASGPAGTAAQRTHRTQFELVRSMVPG